MTSQNMAALSYGNNLRIAAAATCRELRSRPRSEALSAAAALLEDPPEPIQRMRVGRFLLLALPGIGKVVSHKILTRAEIFNSTRQIGPSHRGGLGADRGVRPLTGQQRRRLAAELRRRAT